MGNYFFCSEKGFDSTKMVITAPSDKGIYP